MQVSQLIFLWYELTGQTTWANAEPIVEHQTSVTKLLAYFHREVKGFVAMKTIAEAHQCGMPIEEINLHVEQLAFVAKTAAWAAENSMPQPPA